MLAALLILPVIAGYIIVNSYPPYKFASARENNHRLYFRCVQNGLILSIIAVITHCIFYAFFENGWYQDITTNLNDVFKTKSTVTSTGKWTEGGAAAILLWTYIYSFIIFLFFKLFKKFSKEKYEEKMQKWHSTAISTNPLLKLVNEHGYRNNSGSSIMFTLNTGKIYIGWVKNEPEPSHDNDYIRILPLLSGYRETETHKEKFVTFYTAVIDKVESSSDGPLEHLTEDSFDIVFPVNSTVSAHPFQLEAYKLFKEQASEFDKPPSGK